MLQALEFDFFPLFAILLLWYWRICCWMWVFLSFQVLKQRDLIQKPSEKSIHLINSSSLMKVNGNQSFIKQLWQPPIESIFPKARPLLWYKIYQRRSKYSAPREMHGTFTVFVLNEKLLFTVQDTSWTMVMGMAYNNCGFPRLLFEGITNTLIKVLINTYWYFACDIGNRDVSYTWPESRKAPSSCAFA